MLFYIYLKTQLLILKRNANLLSKIIILYVSIIVMFFAMQQDARAMPVLSRLNVPFLGFVFVCLGSVDFFSDLFCAGENEKRLYTIAPWNLRSNLISKNIGIIFIILTFGIPIIIFTAFLFPDTIHNYFNIGLYFFTSFPVFMILGNRISVSKKGLKPRSDNSEILIPTFGTALVAQIPYAIFKLWLHSIPLCVLFSLAMLSLWYFHELPTLEKKFLFNYLQITD